METVQDKELREKIKTIIIGFDGGNWYDQKADSIMQLLTADRKRVALEARINELPFLKGMKETSASLLEDGSGDFVRVQDLDTRLGDWISELEMLTQQRKEK